MPLTAPLLLLADSRLPAGGHAHSGGLEAAATAGRVGGMSGLEGFLRGRLATAGLASAGLAAAACQHAAAVAGGAVPRWAELDAEAAARTPSPAQRRAARAQGRALLRAARAAWPHPVLDALAADRSHDPAGPLTAGPLTASPGAASSGAASSGASSSGASSPGASSPGAASRRADGPFHAIILGACVWVAGGTPADAAVIAATAAISGPAAAAIRLLGLDPLAVTGLLARLAGDVAGLAEVACRAARAGDWAALPAPASPGLDLLAQRHALQEVALFES